MRCGFILDNYSTEIVDLLDDKVEEFARGEKWFSICVDKEYYIFIDNGIYTEENMNKIAPIMADLNKRLMLLSV